MKSVSSGLALAIVLAATVPLRAELDRTILDAALARLPAVEYGDDRAPLDTLDRFVAAAHDDAVLRAELENRFITVLYSEATLAAKDYACRSLRLVGTRKAIPALASLLPHPQLSGLARYGLEPMPYPEVELVLREALPSLAPRQQIGVLTSLGVRRDAAAVPVIQPLIRERDPQLAQAAIIALGKIGSTEAADALAALHGEAEGARQALAAQGCVEVAWSLVRDGQREAAATMFTLLFGAYPEGYLHEAAFEGLVAAEPERANGRLIAALAGDDDRLRKLASRLVVEHPARRTPAEFLRELPALPVAGQIALLDAFARRGDASTREGVLAQLGNPDERVRLAAIQALGAVGGSADLLGLARLAADGRGVESEAARDSLATLPGREVEVTMAEAAALEANSADVRTELLKSLVARNARDQAGAVVSCLDDGDRGVNRAAILVLTSVGTEAEIPAIIRQLLVADAARRAELASALELICGRVGERASAPMLAGLVGAGPETRAVLLRLLSPVGGAEALIVLRQAVNDPDPAIRDAAVRALTEWRDLSAAADLVAIVREPAQPAYRVLAFRGYVRLVRESGLEPGPKLDHLRTAMSLARDAAEKRLVIAALGDVPSVAAMSVAAEYLTDPGLADEAGAAVVRIATSLGATQKEAIRPVLEAVLANTRAKPVTDSVRALQRKLR